MLEALKLWLGRLILAVIAVSALAYLGDWAVFLLRGSPQGQVVVSEYLATPLKGQKTEYDYAGTGPEPCAEALFPRADTKPCWYLRKHPTQFE